MFGIITRVIKDMVVNEEQMKENIGRSYNIFFTTVIIETCTERYFTKTLIEWYNEMQWLHLMNVLC